MRKRLATTTCLLTLALVATSTAQARPTSLTWHQRTVTFLRHRIVANRQATWRYQRMAGRTPTRTAHAERRTQSVPFLRWIRRLWTHRRAVAYKQAHPSGSVPALICSIFGAAQCSEALSVARCESGFSTTAVNGQYLGIYQMGSAERARFATAGYSTAYEQIVAAHNYFLVSGWAPWSCA